MKKYIILIATMALCLCSCSVKEDLVAMDQRIDNLEVIGKDYVAQQIQAAKADLANLKKTQATVDANVASLEALMQGVSDNQSEATLEFKSNVAALKMKSEQLSGMIESLQNYVDDQDKQMFVEVVDITMERLVAYKVETEERLHEIEEIVKEVKDFTPWKERVELYIYRDSLNNIEDSTRIATDSIRIDRLLVDVAGIRDSVEFIYNEETGVVGRITRLENTVYDSIEVVLKDHSDSLKILQGHIDTASFNIRGVISEVDIRTNTRIDTLVSGSIDTLAKRILKVNERVDSINTDFTEMQEQINGMQEHIGEMDITIALHGRQIDSLRHDVDSLGDVTSTLDDRIDSLAKATRDSLKAHRDSLEQFSDSLADHGGRISRIEDIIDGLDVEEISARLDALEDKFNDYPSISASGVTVVVGESKTVKYTASCGKGGDCSVTAVTDGNLILKLNEADSTVTVTTQAIVTATSASFKLVATNTYGLSAVCNVPVTVTARSITGLNKEYNVLGAAGNVSVTASNNFDMTVKSDADWITETTVSAGSSSFNLPVTANNEDDSREAVVYVYPDAAPDVAVASFVVKQQRNFSATMKLTVNTSVDKTVTVPLYGECNVTVKWGEGDPESFNGNIDFGGQPTHTYSGSGSYTIEISGNAEGLSAIKSNHVAAITGVTSWGDLGFKTMYGAFYKCSNLSSVAKPGNFAKLTDASYMFYGCTSLTAVDNGFFSSATNVTTFEQTFAYSAITNISGIFASNTNAVDFTKTFAYCYNVTSVDGAFSGCTNAKIFNGTFAGCSFTSVPANLFASATKATSFEDTFYRCKKLASIPANLFASNPDVETFAGCFTDCTGLTSIPVSIFDNNKKVNDFSRTFWMCDKIDKENCESPSTGGVKLWDRGPSNGFVKPALTKSCFDYATFKDVDSVPAQWK